MINSFDDDCKNKLIEFIIKEYIRLIQEVGIRFLGHACPFYGSMANMAHCRTYIDSYRTERL